MNFAAAVATIGILTFAVLLILGRRLQAIVGRSPRGVLSNEAGAADARVEVACRCGVYVGLDQVSWPFAWLGARRGSILVRARLAAVLKLTPGHSSIPSAAAIDVSSIRSIRRTGLLMQWGVVLTTPDGDVGLWGPGVLDTLRAAGSLPAVRRDRRRLFWRADLWRSDVPDS